MQRVMEQLFIARMIVFATYQSPMENPPGGYTLLRALNCWWQYLKIRVPLFQP